MDEDIDGREKVDGFIVIRRSRLQALLQQSAAVGWDAAVEAMCYEDGTKLDVVECHNPFANPGGDAS